MSGLTGVSAEDLAACTKLLAGGSKSFRAASFLLPRRIAAPAAALYAFCRVADDAIDMSDDPASSLVELHQRLDGAYAARPWDHVADRAFAAVVAQYGVPRALPAALLEGFAWDAEGRFYEDIAALEAKAPGDGKLEAFLRAQGFRSILARMGFGEASGAPHRGASRATAPEAPAAEAPNVAVPFGAYDCVTDEADLARWVALAREAGVVAVDTETDSLDARRATMVGFSLAIAPGRACYVPIRHGSVGDMLAAPAPQQIAPEAAFALLRPLFTDAAVLKVFQHAKYDLEVLARAENGGFAAISPIDDTMMLSYAMEAGRHGHGMDELSVLHLGHQPITFDEVTGTGKARLPFSEVPLDKATAYAAEDADVTLRLWLLLRRLQAQGVARIQGDILLDRSAFALAPRDPASFDVRPPVAWCASC